MLDFIFAIFMILLGYLLGSISSAILVSKIMRLPDPRTSGSGNPGTTNVLRLGGKVAAAATLLGDVLKGFIPVILAKLLHFPESIVALTAVSAFLGHIYPLYFGFKGGKGVATGLGVLLALSPIIAFVLVVIWIFILILFRYSSLAALTSVSLGVFFAWKEIPVDDFRAYLFLTVIIVWRHRSNIVRLIQGKESKVGKKTQKS